MEEMQLKVHVEIAELKTALKLHTEENAKMRQNVEKLLADLHGNQRSRAIWNSIIGAGMGILVTMYINASAEYKDLKKQVNDNATAILLIQNQNFKKDN